MPAVNLDDLPLGQRTETYIRSYIDHEEHKGIHTYHACACGRRKTRSVQCGACWQEVLAEFLSRPPAKLVVECGQILVDGRPVGSYEPNGDFGYTVIAGRKAVGDVACRNGKFGFQVAEGHGRFLWYKTVERAVASLLKRRWV